MVDAQARPVAAGAPEMWTALLSDAELHLLAEEQAALRRVATLVARGIPEEELFAAVTEEVGRVLLVDVAALSRYESDNTMTNLAIWRASGGTFPAVGKRHPLGGQNTSTLVFETGRPARIDAYPGASDSIATVISGVGVRSSVGAPISVEGRLWGVIHAASTREQPLPADAETRLASFTELVAMAIANAESRVALARLVEEQAALRRVATLVARGAPPEQVFASVTEEVGQLLPVDFADLSRYELDGTVTILATWGITHAVLPSGARLRLGGKNLSTVVAETGASARIESYADASGPIGAAVRKAGVRTVVGTPIIVDGRLWGMTAAGSRMRQTLAGGHRGAARVVHGAVGDGDRECRESRRAHAARGGAGCVAAGRDAGRSRRAARAGVRGGHRGGRAAAPGRFRAYGPL